VDNKKYILAKHSSKQLAFKLIYILSMDNANGLIKTINVILISILTVAILVSLVISLLISNSIFNTEIGGKVSALDNYSPDGLQKYIECSSKYPNEVINNYSIVRNKLCAPEATLMLNMNKESMSITLLILLFVIGTPYIIYFPFRKRWDKLFPWYAAWREEKKLAIFTSADVKKNLYDYDKAHPYFVELPVFENIVLDFKSNGDFNNYLKEIEIREHAFKYYKPKKRKLKDRTEINEWVWYARFYFSEKPKQGTLEVIFR
jgi:hypothetical protein